MRIDAYTHFMPKPFLQKMEQIGGDKVKDIGKRVRGVPAIMDLDLRRKIVDSFDDYRQIISYSMPPIEDMVAPGETEEICKIINDGFVEICNKHPDQFAGWVAQVSLGDPEGAAREAERAIKQLGALGVQIYTNIQGKPLDRPEFAVFWTKMNELKMPVWVHPSRGANFPDYLTEKKSLYEMWWALGWAYETAAFMSRLVFSKTLDNNPDLKIIVHHFGGIVPMLEGRLGPGWDQLGARTSDEDYGALKRSLKKRPLDYFKQNFVADTAVFGGKPATVCGMDFFPHDRIVFASDCPFDPEKGPGYIRETLKILESLPMSKAERDAIYFKNLERLTGQTFAKQASAA
jgi:aminocarboxymuconate-semialdehyde decarboxylase